MATEYPAVDTPVYSTVRDDPDLHEIVQLFVEEMPGRISTLVEQLQEGNLKGLQDFAHRLKGCAGAYGFPTVTSAAARVEDAARDHNENLVYQSVAELVDLCSRARA